MQPQGRPSEDMKHPSKNADDELAAADAAAAAPRALPEKQNKRYGYRFVKRAFDIVSSGLALLLLSPLLAAILLVKWLEDAGAPAYRLSVTRASSPDAPLARRAKRFVSRDGTVYDCVLLPRKLEKGEKRPSGAPVYASDRVGMGGKIFRFYKIRSMCPGAEEMKQQLIDAGLNEADLPAFKMKDDPRITPFGRVLRKLSLDELPQLFNVLRGDMSVVGPRPPLPAEVRSYTAEQRRRLEVKGGLLCLWQICHNRHEMTFEEWVALDLEYIRRRSVLLDLKIVCKGAYMVLFDRSGE